MGTTVSAVRVVLMSSSLIFLQLPIYFTNGFRSSTVGRNSRIPINTISSSSSIPVTASLSLANNIYGRGAYIWPESSEGTIELSNSFPNGIIPSSVIIQTDMDDSIRPQQIQSSSESSSTDTGSRNRKYDRNEIRSIDKIPIAIGLSLAVRGLVRPMDVALVACWTTYFIILNMTAQSIRESTGAPIMPAVPPQGHVPAILSNPMGILFQRSVLYRRWLNLGAVVGLGLPLALLIRYLFQAKMDAARVLSRPLFLLCCQVVTEAISRRNLIPLPLRILIPLIYNASRLAYLWSWVTTSTILGRMGLGLGIINFVYWAVNLFVFLIPIASVRYMRAYFFGVEAEEVTTRIGLEETAGLIPNYNS